MNYGFGGGHQKTTKRRLQKLGVPCPEFRSWTPEWPFGRSRGNYTKTPGGGVQQVGWKKYWLEKKGGGLGWLPSVTPGVNQNEMTGDLEGPLAQNCPPPSFSLKFTHTRPPPPAENPFFFWPGSSGSPWGVRAPPPHPLPKPQPPPGEGVIPAVNDWTGPPTGGGAVCRAGPSQTPKTAEMIQIQLGYVS